MALNRIELSYGAGKTVLRTSAWPHVQILLPSPPAAIAADLLPQQLAHALDNPHSAQPLAQQASQAKSACIVVADRTRRYGLCRWMPALLDNLNRAGLPDTRIMVLIGNGTHGGHSAEKKAALVGSSVTDRVLVLDHHADDARNTADLGRTPAGTPVKINKIFMDADLKIVTGAVAHHYYAGFTGGRKGIMPGAAARDTIEHNHSLVLHPAGGINPSATIGKLEGNPVHEDMLAAALMAGDTFLINMVTDGAGDPAGIFTGSLRDAHAQAVALARKSYEIPLAEQFDLVIASCGGAPKDINFYQTHKSYNNAFQAVRPGGAVVLLAECPEGLGPDEFAFWFEIADMDKIEEGIRKKYSVPGQTAMATLRKAAAATTILVSGLPPEAALLMNMQPARTLEQALTMVPGSPASVAVMPKAALTVPVAAQD